MTYSETKFREYIKRESNDPQIYIRKTPDKKQGSTTTIGMPDYLIISRGKTVWYEVKLSHTKTTFNLNEISESQYIEFDKMHNAGAIINLAIYVNKVLYIVPYLKIRFAKFTANEKSIKVNILDSWRIQW